MKKLTLYTMLMITSLTLVTNQSAASTKNPITTTDTPKEVPTEVKVLLSRLDEIKAMDKSELNSSEKKVLRKEVKAIKSTLKATGNGVYLSVGAIIIIILLLILLL
jgi:Skp family chaperone for outer membrane proteins